MRDELERHTAAAEKKIADALQEFHDATGLIPSSIAFDMIDTRSFEQVGTSKRVASVGILQLHARM